MNALLLLLIMALLPVPGILKAEEAAASRAADKTQAAGGLTQVKRIYVAPLTGGAPAEALRELIISGIDATKLFVLTENEQRADAILKGAADDKAFENTFDSSGGASTRENGGKYGSGSTTYNKVGGGYLSVAGAETESHHIKERKHEAYATVRLCSKDGDVLWSTTQESQGAKFRGASADVAAKIARQLSLDVERERRPGAESVASK